MESADEMHRCQNTFPPKCERSIIASFSGNWLCGLYELESSSPVQIQAVYHGGKDAPRIVNFITSFPD